MARDTAPLQGALAEFDRTFRKFTHPSESENFAAKRQRLAQGVSECLAGCITIGDRKGVWRLCVTVNYRMTFRVDAAEGEIYDVDLEDYH